MRPPFRNTKAGTPRKRRAGWADRWLNRPGTYRNFPSDGFENMVLELASYNPAEAARIERVCGPVEIATALKTKRASDPEYAFDDPLRM